MAQSRAGFSRTWYQFQNAFRLAVDSIRAHKLRSFLTLLGVIIGVASVILVGAAIEGLGVYAEGPITDPKDLGPALKRAIAVVKRGEPALLDVVTIGR